MAEARDGRGAQAEAALARAVLDTVFEAFGARGRWGLAALALLLGPAVRATARVGRAFEARVAAEGALGPAAAALLARYAGSVTIEGAEAVPRDGPLLLVANHAGMGDALGVLAATPRRDVAVMVQRRGLLTALPEFARHSIVIDPARPSRALRDAIARLETGGALLVFPAGRIEPDPRLDQAGARAALEGWSASPMLLARAVPALALVPAAVGGLTSPRALRLPFVRARPSAEDRAFAAATLQLLLPGFRDTRLRVVIGAALRGPDRTTAAIAASMRTLLGRAGA